MHPIQMYVTFEDGQANFTEDQQTFARTGAKTQLDHLF